MFVRALSWPDTLRVLFSLPEIQPPGISGEGKRSHFYLAESAFARMLAMELDEMKDPAFWQKYQARQEPPVRAKEEPSPIIPPHPSHCPWCNYLGLRRGLGGSSWHCNLCDAEFEVRKYPVQT